MIRHRPPREVLENLRFALEVMEEKSHFGLNDQAADALRIRILDQIAKVEAEIARSPGAPTLPASPILELPE